MALDGVTWLLVVLNAVVLVVAVAAAAYLLGRPGDQPDGGAEEWYEGAGELVREVQATVDAIEPPADPDRTARRLLPLSGRIRRHVRAAPRSVDPNVHRQLFQLATRCQQVAIEHEPVGVGSGPFLEDRLDALREDASEVETHIPPPG